MKIFHYAVVLLFPLALTVQAQEKKEEKPIASLDGKPVYLSEIETPEINKLRLQLHEKLMEALTQKIEATPHQGEHKHDHAGGHHDPIKHAVLDGRLELMLTKPEPLPITLDLHEAFQDGRPDAQVMIMEFIDSQCGFCREMLPIVDRLKRKYRGKVALATRHFPLDSHEGSREAANAMECARAQDRFREYKSALLNNPKKQSLTDLERYAKQVHVEDLPAFMDCVNNMQFTHRLITDYAVGTDLGFDGTPYFVVGRFDANKQQLTGRIIEGALTFQEFCALIDTYLK